MDQAKAAIHGMIIGPYRIVEPIGEGGMGIVYRAEHVETGRRVAIKTVKVPDQRMLSSIRREVLALSTVVHPGIVRIEAHGIHEGLPWYAMELLEGWTLQEHFTRVWSRTRAVEDETTSTNLVASSGVVAAGSATFEDDAEGASAGDDPARGAFPMPLTDAGAPARRIVLALTLARRLCDPLAYLHQKGIVHRDLKPANVFLRHDGTPMLMDFGIVARFAAGVGREVLEIARGITGTVHYMAPEQIMGQIVDPRADLYSLGCMLYEGLTGRVPFRGRSTMEVLGQHLLAVPEPPSRLAEGISPALDTLVMRLLAKQPRDRTGHAVDVARALVALGAEGGEPAPELQPPGFLYRPGFAGRSGILDELNGCVAALQNGTGGCVLLGGESGAGKTRLATEVGRLAAAGDVQVITGECTPAGAGDRPSVELRGAPLHPFAPFLQTVADQCHEGGPEETARLLGGRGRVLAEYEPALAAVPAVADQPPPAPLAGEAAHQRLLEALRATLVAFAEREPVLLVLDDLQWADELSLAFLRSFTEDSLRRSRLLILATFRAEEVDEGLRTLLALPWVRRVDVTRLDEPTVGAIVADMLAMTPPENFVRFLSRRSSGNPFFVAECLRVALEERILFRSTSGQWALATEGDQEALYEALPLPRSIHDLVGRRLRGLSAEARKVLAVAAVIGRDLETDCLAAVVQMDEVGFMEAVRELIARNILEEPAAGELRFCHDKLREIAYDGVEEASRRELHRAVAEVIEARYAAEPGFSARYRELVHHYTEARVWPRVLDYLEKAGEQALRSYSNREAAAYFAEAVALNASEGLGADALRLGRFERALTEAQLNLGNMTTGWRHAERALAHFGHPLPASAAGWALGLLGQIVRRWLHRPAAGPAPALDERQRSSMREAAYVYNRMLEQYLIANDALRGVYCGMVNLNLAEALPPSPELARGYAMMCIAVGLMARSVADGWSRRALEIAEEVGDAGALAWSLGRVSVHAVHFARWASAYEWLERAIAIARELGDKRISEECIGILANGRHLHGRFPESLQAWNEVFRSTLARGDTQTECWARIGVAQNFVRLGQHDEALEAIEGGQGLLERHAAETEKLWASGVLALAHLRAGDADRARAAADRALARMKGSRPVVFYVYAAVRAVPEVYLTLWEQTPASEVKARAELRRAARAACDFLRVYSWMFPFAGPAAALCRGRLAWLEGSRGRARRAWKEALAQAQRQDMAYEEGLARWELGRDPEAPAPREELTLALACFERVGATPDGARVRALLEAPRGDGDR